MKYISLFSLLLVPFITSASVTESLTIIEDSSKVFETISLWSAIIVAFVTSVMVWWGGRQMHGGVLGKVLVYFSIGMTLIFLGFVAGTPLVDTLMSALYLQIAHDSLFIVGYIFMGLGASKLLKTIKGE